MGVSEEFWYCVACYVGSEEAVCRQLSRAADLRVFLPKMPVKNNSRRAATTRRSPIFPGYLFVKMRLMSSLSTIRYTPGVRDIVRFGTRIPIVSDEVIRDLEDTVREAAEPIWVNDMEAGMTACVNEGPFQGFFGTVLRVSSTNDRVQLLIELLGQSRILEIERDAIQLGC